MNKKMLFNLVGVLVLASMLLSACAPQATPEPQVVVKTQVELPPFQAAVRAGVKLVMAGHMLLPALSEREDLPVLFSPAILRGLLRQEMGFEGLVVSDALDMGPVARGAGLAIDSIAALAAGVDLLLFGPGSEAQEAVLDGLVQAARRRLLDARDLEASAGRVLGLKRWLAGREQPPLEVVGCAEHQALALEIAQRAVTLVRDINPQLPLRLAPDQRLLVVLPKPADLTPADTSSYERLSLAETIRRYHPATDELFISIDPTPAEIAAVREQAQDYALVIAGTINALDHERQADLIGTLMETGVPTLVIALRAPFDLLRFPQVPFYACTYSLQPPALQALVEALWGEIPWQGKLPVSLPGASV
jgi:beta-N-acetylhexosaminidase